MSEFSDRPFALGTLIGLRSFRVDHYGRLKATALDVVWTPGENVARCFHSLVAPPSMYSFAAMTSSLLYGGGGYSTPAAETKPKKPPTDHRPGALECTCGFYAYFDEGKNRYHQPGQLRAVVEGYGLVTVGQRGFRAEKARILGLVIPPKKVNASTDAVRANYPDVTVFESRAHALHAHPLVRPSLPSPDVDPDFWTREAL